MRLKTANTRRKLRHTVRLTPPNYVRYIQALYGKTLEEGEAILGFKLRAIEVDDVEIEPASKTGDDVVMDVSIRRGRIVDVWEFA